LPYKAKISHANPTCFIFLIDQSKAMNDPIPGVKGNLCKSKFVGDGINRISSNEKDRLDCRRYNKYNHNSFNKETAMSYQAEISRMNPTCFFFLIDQSGSMNDPIMGVQGN